MRRLENLSERELKVTLQMPPDPKVRKSQHFKFGLRGHQSVKTYQPRLSVHSDYRENLARFRHALIKYLTCPTLTLTRIFDTRIVRFLIDNKLQLKVLISRYDW